LNSHNTATRSWHLRAFLVAIQRQEEFGSAADSDTVLMFAADVREARTEFLLTLEAVYRGEDVRPANDGSLVS
jgi:hypothetical protein